MAHTPGPWWRDDDGFIAAGSGESYVTIADFDCSDLDFDEREANKALAIAAPAMLAALEASEGVLSWLADQGNAAAPGVRDMVRAAIAAATGAPTDEPAREYMAFCQQADGRGTIWIDKVRGDTIEAATAAAREACAADWGCKADKVHCLGLIEGKATVAHWQDVCDVPAATGER